MTLLLVCLTPNAIYQVSDRRITNLLRPDDVMTEEQSKAVMIGKSFRLCIWSRSEYL